MFSSAPYDTWPDALYVFTCTVILKLKSFMVNNILFYNMSVRDMGMPQCIVNIKEGHKTLIENVHFILNKGV